MKDEKAEFAKRLRTALREAGIEASAAVVEKRFNSRYGGTPVTAQAISQWLNGRVMPRQDKIRTLASIVGVDPQTLQYGTPSRTGEARQDWSAGLGPQDRVMVDGYLTLSSPQRKLVRELVAALTGVSAKS
ncbi:transcriptional regulator [Solilutibacter silvestris]|uniref:Helix-turn-helix protein n=1 Tax=Solilutibacter silvestris TaxID=1645665 RepID=A0A2K1Q050_9GAMM|nr:transcriptional regulator [Lysobacter silvestris]PNS08418.1 helix-turn-helix protein [Lysobacter silvestris]